MPAWHGMDTQVVIPDAIITSSASVEQFLFIQQHRITRVFVFFAFFCPLISSAGRVLPGQRGADPHVRDGHQERREGDGGALQGLQQHPPRRFPRQRELLVDRPPPRALLVSSSPNLCMARLVKTHFFPLPRNTPRLLWYEYYILYVRFLGIFLVRFFPSVEDSGPANAKAALPLVKYPSLSCRFCPRFFLHSHNPSSSRAPTVQLPWQVSANTHHALVRLLYVCTSTELSFSP